MRALMLSTTRVRTSIWCIAIVVTGIALVTRPAQAELITLTGNLVTGRRRWRQYIDCHGLRHRNHRHNPFHHHYGSELEWPVWSCRSGTFARCSSR
jgi:hypothetical protein